ncbi:MAG: hypothetical protein ACI4EV_02235 [Lachnospiraceae bacterium]
MADLSLQEIKDNLRGIHVPILTLDEHWYQLIPDNEKSDEIKLLEKKVNEYLKRQGQVNNDLKEVKKIKNKLIQEVVDNMESDGNDPKTRKKMEQNQRLIQESKDKIAQLEDEVLEVPKFLAQANLELLAATVKYCYRKLNANKSDIEVLDKWINETRIKLKKNLLIKQDKENKNNKIYSYMHDVLGPDVMGVLDRINEQ